MKMKANFFSKIQLWEFQENPDSINLPVLKSFFSTRYTCLVPGYSVPKV
jgi:hypothetical protein